MPNLINADNGVVSGFAGVRTTADGTGNLALQTNGNTVLTLNTANVATFAGTVTATGGFVVGASAAPAFSAYQSTLQSVSNNTLTKIQLQTEEFDTASAFDSTTNYRFTPQVAGYYQINGAVFFSTATASVIASIYKNGSEYKRGIYFGTSGQSAIVSSLLYLNGSTDYIELYGYQSSGGNLNTQTGITATWFNGCFLRSA